MTRNLFIISTHEKFWKARKEKFSAHQNYGCIIISDMLIECLTPIANCYERYVMPKVSLKCIMNIISGIKSQNGNARLRVTTSTNMDRTRTWILYFRSFMLLTKDNVHLFQKLYQNLSLPLFLSFCLSLLIYAKLFWVILSPES